MNKIIGYALLVIGLAIILFSARSMYGVFVDKQPVAQLIAPDKITVKTQQGPSEIDTAMFAGVLNLALYGIFMLFMVAVGGKVASLGGGLIKTDALAAALKEAKFEDIKKL